jgi:hypothetical protein
MKNILMGAILAAGFTLVAFKPVSKQEINPKTVVMGRVCFKVKNDTGKTQTLHTGSGTVVINNLSSNDICMEDGSILYLADKGNKGKELLKVTSNASGKTFELSKLLK